MALTMATSPTVVTQSDLLDKIMKEYWDGLISYAEKMLGDHGLAEDVVQETIIRAWRNSDRLNGTEGAVRGWLFTVTRHLVIDWVRKPYVRREVAEVAFHDLTSEGDGFEAVDDGMVTRLLLQRLSPEHRAVLVHIYLCDRTIQETAGILGLPTGTVKSRQHNALRKLRTMQRPEAA